jgi:hypothetical protein
MIDVVPLLHDGVLDPRWLQGLDKSLHSSSMTALLGGLGSLTESTEDTEG